MTENTNAVDFSNPEAIANELEAAQDAGTTTATKKEKKPAKPRIIKVTFVADHDITAGESVTFDYEVPKAERHGAVAGIPLEEMTDDQLKIEYRNANSVAYKTKKAGRDATKAEERLERCKAEMEKRGIQPTARAAAKVDAATVANMIKAGTLSVDDIQALLDAQ